MLCVCPLFSFLLLLLLHFHCGKPQAAFALDSTAFWFDVCACWVYLFSHFRFYWCSSLGDDAFVSLVLFRSICFLFTKMSPSCIFCPVVYLCQAQALDGFLLRTFFCADYFLHVFINNCMHPLYFSIIGLSSSLVFWHDLFSSRLPLRRIAKTAPRTNYKEEKPLTSLCWYVFLNVWLIFLLLHHHYLCFVSE